jgi:hypothetical protein
MGMEILMQYDVLTSSYSNKRRDNAKCKIDFLHAVSAKVEKFSTVTIEMNVI